MRSGRPTLAEARALALSSRMREWKGAGLISSVPTLEEGERWRQSSFFLRLVLFGLTLLAIQAFYHLARLMDLPPGWMTGIAACGVAELLIRGKRFLRVGPEEALFIGGLFSVIAGLPGPHTSEGLLLFSGAALLAAWRLMNPFFVLVALILAFSYIWVRPGVPTMALPLAILILAIAAVSFARREVRMPWIADSLQIVIVTMPILAYISARQIVFEKSLLETGKGLGILAAFLGIGGALVVWGGREKIRAFLLSALLFFTLTGIELGRALPWSMEAILIMAGLLVLGVVIVLNRLVRNNPRGWTSAALEGKTDLPMILAAAAMTGHAAHAAPTPSPQIEQGPSSFGGAGSGGEY